MIERCDVCGKLLNIAISSRLAPWEVITCLSPECEERAQAQAHENRKNWRDEMRSDRNE